MCGEHNKIRVMLTECQLKVDRGEMTREEMENFVCSQFPEYKETILEAIQVNYAVIAVKSILVGLTIGQGLTTIAVIGAELARTANIHPIEFGLRFNESFAAYYSELSNQIPLFAAESKLKH